MMISVKACRPLAAGIPAVSHLQQQTPVLCLCPKRERKILFQVRQANHAVQYTMHPVLKYLSEPRVGLG